MTKEYPEMVGVCVITFNHEKYISKMIESVLSQKASFKHILVIGEDCSSDKTRDICISYKKHYPNKIELILNDKNIGPSKNFTNVLANRRGKYVAICEGDDYWIDPHKLQKQVDILEKYPEISMCCHNAEVKYESIAGVDGLFNKSELPSIIETKQLIERFSIPTASIVFRSECLEIPGWLETVRNGDYALCLLLSLRGDIKYSHEVMSVYRRTSTSLSGSYSTIKNINGLLELYSNFNWHSEGRFAKEIMKRKFQLIAQKYFLKTSGVLGIKKI